MELCLSRIFSGVPCSKISFKVKPSLYSTPSLHCHKTRTLLTNPGLHYCAAPVPRATTSEDTSTSILEDLDKIPEEAIVTDEADKIPEEAIVTDETDKIPEEAIVTDEAPVDNETQADEPFDWSNIKLDSPETYYILLYGSGALAVLWISSIIVGAFDSIPLLPKVMEVVGLAFTVWFSYRYLLFKKNRDELLAKIEELKQKVIGSPED